jgi:hypothetical protein
MRHGSTLYKRIAPILPNSPKFNDWYDNEHMPAQAEVPGVLRARRYVAVSGSPLSLSAFELTHREVFESPAWLEARQTPRTERIRKLFTNGRRIMYRLILPTMLPAASSKPLADRCLNFRFYLDNSATTPVDPRVVDKMLPWLGGRFGNPASSSHEFGREARKGRRIGAR